MRKKQATWRSEWVMFQKKASQWVKTWGSIYGTEKKKKKKPRVARVEWGKVVGKEVEWMNASFRNQYCGEYTYTYYLLHTYTVSL